MRETKTVLVTGGAGYVGAVLVPKLIDAGFKVKVIDLYLFGDHVLESVQGNENLIEVKGDIRDQALLERAIPGSDVIIHLACISNDPSYELNPGLGKSINYDAFLPLVRLAKTGGVRQFIYASSSSVYGIKEEASVTEDLPLEPLTDYSKYKAKCEEILLNEASDDFVPTVIRPSTVCGYSPRLRLDLTVNILTNHAINRKEITVIGGDQMRPNIHIEDMAELYVYLLGLPAEKVDRGVYNAGYENFSVRDLALMVQKIVDPAIPIKTIPTNDNRSYRVSSLKIKRELGFEVQHSVEDAIQDLSEAFANGKIPDPFDDIRYYNIKTMQAVTLR